MTWRHLGCIDNPSKIADTKNGAPVSGGVLSSASDDEVGSSVFVKLLFGRS